MQGVDLWHLLLRKSTIKRHAQLFFSESTEMMASSKHLVAALLLIFLLFSLSFAKLLHDTNNPCNGKSLVQLENETTAEGCHFAGSCSTGSDCRQPCAALGRNPDAVKCVSSNGGNRCCCIDS